MVQRTPKPNDFVGQTSLLFPNTFSVLEQTKVKPTNSNCKKRPLNVCVRWERNFRSQTYIMYLVPCTYWSNRFLFCILLKCPRTEFTFNPLSSLLPSPLSLSWNKNNLSITHIIAEKLRKTDQSSVFCHFFFISHAYLLLREKKSLTFKKTIFAFLVLCTS